MKPSTPLFRGPRHTGRSLALHVLLSCHSGDAFVQDILDRALTQSPLDAADRRLATQLAYGVLRRRGSLDALIRTAVTRQQHEVEPWLWDALRLGTFQLALLTHIPPHAALHETVELAAAFGRPAAKGFLNGVLRSLSGLMTDDRTDAPADDALPLEAGQYRRLARPVLPEPAEQPIQYLAAAFSLPQWMAERWQAQHDWAECVRRGFWFAGPAPLWLRCNRLRTERDAFVARLAVAGIQAEAGEHPQAVRLAESMPIRDVPGYTAGAFSVQDQSGMRVVSALSPTPGSRVLDLCAAPGGKTTFLAELMNNQGQVIACDIHDERLQTVRTLSARLGVSIVETVRLHLERDDEPPPGPFDAILVDVPCSNTGVLGRRPEVRWRLKPDEFRTLVPLQTKLLLQAADRIRPGGAIVYSTCSVEPEENRQVVDNVLTAMRELTLEADEEQVPGMPSDGGYWARLRRKGG